MVQVPSYQGGANIRNPRPAQFTPGPAPAVTNVDSVSRGLSGLERGDARLAQGAARLRQGGESVERAAARAAAEAAGAATAAGRVAQAGLQLADTINGFYQREAERNAKELDVQYMEQSGAAMNEYRALRGQEAVDGRKATEERLGELRKELSGQARNPLARRMFDDITRLRAIEHNESMSRHFLGQERIASVDASEAREGAAINNAISNYRNPEVVERDLQTAFSEIDQQAKLHGWGEEVTDFKKLRAESTMRSGIIDQHLAVGDIDGAREYLNSVESRIEADKQILANKKVSSAEDRRERERLAQARHRQREAEALAKAERAKIKRADDARVSAYRRELKDVTSVLSIGGRSDRAVNMLSELAGIDGVDENMDKYADMYEQLHSAVSHRNTVSTLLKQPLQEQDRVLTNLENAARTRDITGDDAELLKTVRTAVRARESAFERGEGVHWAVQQGLLPALPGVDPQNPDPEALALRMDMAANLRDKGYGPVPPLSDSEVDQLSNNILGKTGLSQDERTVILARMGDGLGADGFAQVAAKAANKAPEVTAVMSTALEGDIATARDMLAGGDLLRDPANVVILPKGVEADAEFNNVVENLALPDTAALLGPISAGAKALYAARSVGSDDFDVSIYRKAIMDTIGGIVEHNGRNNIPPKRGMSQDVFDDLVGGMNSGDLIEFGNGAPVINGEPFTMTDLESKGFFTGGVENQLISVGNGGYVVYQPGTGAYVRTTDGRVYELELGDYFDSGK